MDNQLHIETNIPTKYLSTKDDQIVPTSIYGTRKSSRRLNQINVNSDHNFSNLDQTVKDVKESSPNELSKNNLTIINNQTNQANNQINQSATSQQPIIVTKQQRKWEQWLQDDTRWFFEALNENGKDFNAIHSYMVNRLKKKGVSEDLIKNKEQIRCYFNRQYNKISSIFDNNDEQEIANLDKTTKQLYALINYGEMWKKNNFRNDLKIDTKFKAHLNELVFKGYTFLKIGKKGKNVKLKTPLCKALKKIYYFENIYKSINQNLPKEIVIECVPATNYAWMHVHSLAQNPRVRIKCPLQKRFSNLIKYLEDRWNEQKYNNYQLESLTNECLVKSPKNGNDKSSEELLNSFNESTPHSFKKVFKVKPHPNHHKNLSGLKFTRIQPLAFNSQMDISLSAYLLKANSKQLNEQQKVKRKYLNVNCSKKTVSKDEEKTADEAKAQELINHSERSNTSHVLATVRELNLLNKIVSNYKENVDDQTNEQRENLNDGSGIQVLEEKSIHLTEPPPNATIAEWLSANIAKKSTHQQAKKYDSPTKEDEYLKKIESQQDQQESIYYKMKKIVDPLTVKNGWSSDGIEDLTIGELYLMLRKPTKIVLQYDWDVIDLNQSNDGKEAKHFQSNGLSTNIPTNHATNCSSLISKLIAAVSIEMMSSSKEKINSMDLEGECASKNGPKNRKNKKLKISHCAGDNSVNVEPIIEHNVPTNEQISSSLSITELESINKSVKNDHHQVIINTKTKDQFNIDKPTISDEFIVPCSPVPKFLNRTPNKNRIVNGQLLQEAKGQLNNIQFNPTRRNLHARKPQQFQLNLNTNQLLGSNICHLIANQTGTALTTLPVNVSSSSSGQAALISVLTQNGNTPVQIIDGTNAIQFNNATTLNDLCTFVQTNCSNNEVSASSEQSNLSNSNKMEDMVQVIPTTISNDSHPTLNEKETENKFSNSLSNQLNSSINKINEENNQSSTPILHESLGLSIINGPNMNNLLNDHKTGNNKLNSQPFNDNSLKSLNDDKSVGFGNLLELSLSDTIFNDSLPFPSDVSIDSNFSTKDDQTLNTPIKITHQKSAISHTIGNSFASHLNLFDSSLGNNLTVNNRTDSNNSFTDGWINNLGSEISLNNTFNIFADCANDKKDELYGTNFDGVLNVDRINTPTDSSK